MILGLSERLSVSGVSGGCGGYNGKRASGLKVYEFTA